MNELPVGRRVAQWRVRRNMTQQQFADRLGRSKSWVDKVDRGVRRLERVSSLREVADALRIDLGVLLAEQSGRPDPAAVGVEGVRAALARYHVESSAGPVDVAGVRARLSHAEQTYRHARYPQLLALLPDLLGAARAVRAVRPDRGSVVPLVRAYGLTALVLVKVDRGELAWLAADRAMALALAVGDPQVVAAATVPLAQVLRHADRTGAAMAAAVVAVHRLRSACPGAAAGSALLGTLLLQAALAAAGQGPGGDVRRLFDQADEVARRVEVAGQVEVVGREEAARQDEVAGRDEVARQVGGGDGGFGPAVVEAARVVAEVALGDGVAATVRHERLMTGDQWRWLPTEHRAAYLLDVARAYVLAGDLGRAGRTVLEAERTARSEVHDRPAARDLVAVVARSADAPADLGRLAAALHVT